MNVFKNKYFLLGNLAFLLLVIPVALFIIKNQTSTRGSAAATTTLSFNNSVTTDQCTEKNSTLVLKPEQNIVSTVQLALKWDKSKFEIVFKPNKSAFPQTLKGPDQTATGMTITLNTGDNVTKAITTTTDVGTVTIKPLSPTAVGTTSPLSIDAAGTKVYSLSQQDGATENVFNAAGSSPLDVTIAAKTCTTTPLPTPTSVSTVIPTPTNVAALPTSTANQPPVCLSLNSSSASGSAPLSVTLTAAGQDTNGTLIKAVFNFGDGSSQEVTSGLGSAAGSAQIAHTYTSGGSFSATAVFTDNSGAVSATCTKLIAVTGAFATLAPTVPPPTATVIPTATPAPIAADLPTATPTIAESGNLAETLGIIGGVALVIIAGIFLFLL